MTARSKKPALVADVVARFLAKRHGHPSRTTEATTMKVFSAFAKIGPPFTEQAEVVGLKHGVLSLVVGESSWLTELTFLRPQIVERLNGALGAPVVKEIRLRLGTLAVRKRSAAPGPPNISAAQRARIDEWGGAIADQQLREAMKRAAARSLERSAKADKRRRPYEGPPGPAPAKNDPAPAVPAAPPEPVDRWAPDRDRWRDKKNRDS